MAGLVFFKSSTTSLRRSLCTSPTDFPWRLSKDVEHHVMWFRPPLVTPAAFKRLRRDRAYPKHEFKTMKDPRGEALIEYLNENDIYGWTGLPPSAVSPFRQSSELHPMEAIWRSQSGEPISREQAAEAIRWVARHTNRLIEKQFPPSLYETVWNRTNYRVRSILEPNHIHVLVIPKTSPYSYFSQYLRSLTLHGYGRYALRARKKYKKTSIEDVLPQNSYSGYNLRARKNYGKTINKDIFHQELAT
ncbi:hypothetical protein PGTUg99_019730 [Puccinia graminis f. sp. tritici]|uniref:Uncharacterized protein n=1 Tax=Puccinia graminis f. sp. tritici TaxID=56615 RepID=A0A5B0S7H0_PUCGR|nr:hypothetical protein PGTUg99_019730 [Puccinia graminis f. sp. tritici]